MEVVKTGKMENGVEFTFTVNIPDAVLEEQLKSNGYAATEANKQLLAQAVESELGTAVEVFTGQQFEGGYDEDCETIWTTAFDEIDPDDLAEEEFEDE